MKTPRPTTLVHPVTGVGSFFVSMSGRGCGAVLGCQEIFRIGVVQDLRVASLVCWAGCAEKRVVFCNFRACETQDWMYWGIHPWHSSRARSFSLVYRAAVTGRRMPRKEAGSHARYSSFITRHAILGSRRTERVARHTNEIKIRTVRPARRTGCVVR